MGAEKKSSKSGGGYVGGFLQLFDWNGKSRKKLFSNKSDFQEGPKLGKRSHSSSPTTRSHMFEDEDNVGASIKGSSDYSCASSVTDEEAHGTKAPGVVARLMGLDSLPTSSVAEPYSIPYLDSRYLRDVQQRRTPDLTYPHQIMNSGKQPIILESVSRNHVESRSQRMTNKPIERFQTEVLPPKSAKAISITHHKLLSPIKSPGFIPTKNAAQIMEAAARIIEPGPRANTKGKMPPVGSSSGPLRLRNLKEKMESVQKPSRLSEASQRPVESKAVMYLKGQSMNKSWNGVEDMPQSRPSSSHSEDGSSAGLRSKGKSVSLAVQAKVNVQRRESSSRSLHGQKEHNEFNLGITFKSQQNTQRTVQKKPSVPAASGVLRQNNQKQNCSTKIDKATSKASVSSQKGRRPLSGDGSFGRNKIVNKVAGNSKVGLRNTGLDTNDTGKGVPLSRTQIRPQKRRSIEGNLYMEKDERFTQRNATIEAHSNLVEDNKWKGMEVVSFTFTSPMKKAMPGSQSSKPVLENHNSFTVGFSSEKVPTDTKNTKLLSLGLNEIGGDALSILLEQKLRELTQGIGTPFNRAIKSQSSSTCSSILPDFSSDLNAISTTAEECDNRSHHAEELCSVYKSNSFSAEDHMLQGSEEVGDRSINCNSEGRKEFKCRDPSPTSILEPPFSNESCNSSDSGEDNNGSRQCSNSQEVVDSNSSQQLVPRELDADLSDSASSTFLGYMNGDYATRFILADPAKTGNWELEYVKLVLRNTEFMLKDFISGHTKSVINQDLFHQLENRKTRSRTNSDEYNDSKLRRKALFDCVGECLDLRCRPFVGGGLRGPIKVEATLQRKEWLAEEIYKEISSWRSTGDWMLDVLVDKDMSTHCGRWTNFEVDELDLGVEMGKDILSSLVDELVADILV